ncbi:response regulator [Ramlibacter aquaticus]|uniref:histidine kinase n=2 Tax=Ramlibacter TaxID=174951 RepID=A0ABR9SG10_9BURK|nr:ATP-binding protein [Ramlibacter aquaticus]MBE7941290.1 response regulator [Ramlibacter aquaticus]
MERAVALVPLRNPWVRWACALLIPATAALLNVPLQHMLDGRAPLLPFLPAVLLVAFLSGWRPAVLSTVVSGVCIAWAWMEPIGSFEIRREADRILMGAFFAACALGAAVTSHARTLLLRQDATEKRLNLALAAGNMALWQSDWTAGQHWWSPQMYALHGLPPQGPPPADYFSLVHEDDRATLFAAVDAAARQQQDHRVEYRVRWPDGSAHWLEGRGSTTREPVTGRLLMMGVCTGIDARKREEADREFLLHASRELAAVGDRQQALARIARLAVPHFADWCTVDLLAGERLERLAVAHTDPAKEQLAREIHAKYPPRPGTGGEWKVAMTGEPGLVPEITDAMLREGIADPAELAAIRALGLHSWMAVPIPGPGRALGVIAFVSAESRRTYGERELAQAMDLAARAAVALENASLVQALRDADAAKDVFLATLAHELRNPLAPLANGLAILRRAPDPAAALAKVLPILERQGHHLARLVDDLLDMARINSGKIELRRVPLDLREVLQAAADSCRPQAVEAGHVLELQLPEAPMQVLGDAVRLTQVFANLLNNAVKYTPTGGRIRLTAQAGADGHRVSVADNGIGMQPAFLAHAFELFSQAGGAARQGLGVGLYLVRAILEMHGGRISAHSEGPGKGSRFEAWLPVLAAAPRPEAPQAPEPAAAAAGKSVLVVDDNVDAAESLASLLEMMGHRPRVAHDGQAALEACRAAPPDVVLLDIGLPDISGHEVARRIHQMAEGRPRPRLVALTGWGQPEDRRQSQQAGFDAHWTKPVDPGILSTL